MLLSDLVYVLGLVGIVIGWWSFRHQNRKQILIVLCIAVLAAAVISSFVNRWQHVPGAVLALIVLAAMIVAFFRDKSSESLPWFTGSVFTLYTGFCLFLIYTFPVNPLPKPSGEHAVGVADFELVDPTRTGIFGAASDEPRRLLVRVWYPATSTEDIEPRAYFSPLEADTTATGPGSLVGVPFYFTHLGAIETNSYVGAQPVSSSNLPVVIYSHGYTSFLSQNTSLMEELASHGYLVFSVQHPWDSSPTVMPDGDVIPMDPALLTNFNDASDAAVAAFADLIVSDDVIVRQKAAQIVFEGYGGDSRLVHHSADIWVDDRIFVLDRLSQYDVPDDVQSIVELGDYSRTGEMGMSFGGTTSASLCMIDKRCAAVVNIDGGDYHFNTFNRHLPVPLLLLHQDLDLLASQVSEGEKSTGYGFNDFSYERHETAGVREDVVRVSVSGMTHLGFSDFVWFARRPFRDDLLGTITADTGLAIQNDFVRDFLDTYLKCEDVGYPENQLQQYSNVAIKLQNEYIGSAWVAAHPSDATERVIFETTVGEIEFAVYPNRAPLSANNFLNYVDAGHYDGATFYRATQIVDGKGISVVQGGLAADAMRGPAEQVVDHYGVLPRIEHETTTLTGIPNERGTIAYARFDPGTAGSEFFFNIDDNPGLNTGDTSRNRDGMGYATFGRVIRGMRVLEEIQRQPTEMQTSIEHIQGQLLTEPVLITRAYRAGS